MKRRAFLGLSGQAVALVAAAPALVPLATAAPSMAVAPGLGKSETMRRVLKARAVMSDYAANPSLVISPCGRRMYQLRSALEFINEGIDDDLYREFALSTPFDMSTAVHDES